MDSAIRADLVKEPLTAEPKKVVKPLAIKSSSKESEGYHDRRFEELVRSMVQAECKKLVDAREQVIFESDGFRDSVVDLLHNDSKVQEEVTTIVDSDIENAVGDKFDADFETSFGEMLEQVEVTLEGGSLSIPVTQRRY